MASSALSKKRKRDSTDDAGKVSFQLSNEPETRLGPVLGEFQYKNGDATNGRRRGREQGGD